MEEKGFLRLERRVGDTVIVGDPDDPLMKVIVWDAYEGPDGDPRVELAFEAPKDVKIMREEVLRRRRWAEEKN